MDTNKSEHEIKAIEEKLLLLEKQLIQLEEQLIRAQRLASIGTMTSMIAHEFNNILTPIVSYSQFALSRDDPKIWKKALEQVYTNGKEIIEICQQILNFAQGVDTTSSANVQEVIDKCFFCLARAPEKDKIKVTIDVPANINVAIQPALLQQILYNLILNARDAMLQRGGILSIKAEEQDKNVRITVSDTGVGIKEEDAEKIFQPFFSTKKGKGKFSGGSGLGLTITKEIIEKAGGSIEFTSKEGKGTTFIITLPKAG